MAKDYVVSVKINAKDNASGVFHKFSGAVKKSLKVAVAAAVAAATAFSIAAIKWGMAFEKQMSSLEAISRATVGQMSVLSKKAQQLGRDSAFSATEAGKAMEFLAMAGLKPGEVLAAIGETLNLAAAGSLDLAAAADIASNVLTGFNLKAEEMGRVADVIAETAASANTNVLQLGEAMSYAAPQMAAAGWSIEAAAAAIGMLGNAGIQGSRAGTVLRGTITQLLSPTDAAKNAMNALGLSVTDNNDRMLSLAEILEQIDPAILETATGLKYMSDIFGRRAAGGIISLVKQGTDNLRDFTEQLEDAGGAAETMAKTKLDNLSGAFTLLKSSLEAIGIALVVGENSITGGLKRFITEGLIPVINKTAEWIGQVGGLPGMLKIAWEIIVMFANDVRAALTKLFTDWDTFKLFATSFGAALLLAYQALLKFEIIAIKSIYELAKVIWLPLIAPFSVVLSQVRELFMIFMNWINEKFVDAANMLMRPMDWVLEKLGMDIKKIDWTPITVKPALQMRDIWPATFRMITEAGIRSYKDLELGVIEYGDSMSIAGTVIKNALLTLNPEFAKYGERIDDIIDKHKKLNTAVEAFDEKAEEAFENIPEQALAASKGIDENSELYGGVVALGDEFLLNNERIVAAGDEFLLMSKKATGAIDENSTLYQKIGALGGRIGSALKEGWKDYFGSWMMVEGTEVWIPSTLESRVREEMKHIVGAIHGELSGAIYAALSGDSDGEAITFKNIGENIGKAILEGISNILAEEAMKGLAAGAVAIYNALTGENGLGGVKTFVLGLIKKIGEAITLTRTASAAGGAAAAAAGAGGSTGGIIGAIGAVGAVAAPIAAAVLVGKLLYDKYFVKTSKQGDLLKEKLAEYDNNTDATMRYYLDKNSLTALEYASAQILWKNILSEKDRYVYIKEGGEIVKNLELMRKSDERKGFHTGGMIPGEGLFMGLQGEGVLNRTAMGTLGERGLQQMNAGKGAGDTYIFVIQAWDGEDVERVLDRKIIPALNEKSEAGINIIHERGIKYDVSEVA